MRRCPSTPRQYPPPGRVWRASQLWFSLRERPVEYCPLPGEVTAAPCVLPAADAPQRGVVVRRGGACAGVQCAWGTRSAMWCACVVRSVRATCRRVRRKGR